MRIIDNIKKLFKKKDDSTPIIMKSSTMKIPYEENKKYTIYILEGGSGGKIAPGYGGSGGNNLNNFGKGNVDNSTNTIHVFTDSYIISLANKIYPKVLEAYNSGCKTKRIKINSSNMSNDDIAKIGRALKYECDFIDKFYIRVMGKDTTSIKYIIFKFKDRDIEEEIDKTIEEKDS